LRARCDVMANRSDREQGQPDRCLRRHSLKLRMGPCSRTPSGPAVSTDCINRPDRRLHPTNATASIYLLQRGSHPQRTQVGHRAMSEKCHKRKSAGGCRPLARRRPADRPPRIGINLGCVCREEQETRLPKNEPWFYLNSSGRGTATAGGPHDGPDRFSNIPRPIERAPVAY
jgi:hypothetical protein